MIDEAPIELREDTMVYRQPTAETDDTTVQDIWGKRLEIRVVDASEVPAMLQDGWVANPQHIDNPPKPEESAGFVPAGSAELGDLRAEVAAAKEVIDTLKSDLTAAEDLVAAESKAKDAALARVAELEAAAKPKLGIKTDKPPA